MNTVAHATGVVSASGGNNQADRSGRYIRTLRDLTKTDVAIAGGKGANLGEMTRAGLPIPPGFVVTVDAYHRFLTTAGIAQPIAQRLAALDVDDPVALRAASDALQQLVRGAHG